MIDNFDFTKGRPFIAYTNKDLNVLSENCFDKKNLDLEIATLIFEELKLRKSLNSKKNLSILLSKFVSVGHEPIKWLKDARKIMKTIKDIDSKPNYTNSIYIILRDGYTLKNEKYGVYVGQTSKDIEKRYFEHKSGINSGRGLQKYAIQLLRSLWIYGKVKGSKRLYYETKVHLKLKEIILIS